MRFLLPSLVFFLLLGMLSAQSTLPFVRTYGAPSGNTTGQGICPDETGQFYYVYGSTNGQALLIKVNQDGQALWSYSFDFIPNNTFPIYLSEVVVDEEGFLLGCGTLGETPNVTSAVTIAFRFDPQNQQMLWTSVGAFEGYCRGLWEDRANDRVMVYTNPHITPGADDASIVFLDRATGSRLTQNLYDYGSSDAFLSITAYNGNLYAVGRYTLGTGFEYMRHSLTRFDLQANEQWSFVSPVNSSGFARQYGYDLVVDENGITSTFSGDDDGTSLSLTDFFVQRTDTAGNLIWVKKYQIQGLSNPNADEIVKVNDGYVLLGKNSALQGSLFLLKIDKDGNPLWARQMRVGQNDTYSSAAQSQLLFNNNALWLVATSTNLQGASDLLLARLDENGQVSNDCPYLETLTDFTATTLPNATHTPISLSATATSETFTNASNFLQQNTLTLNQNTACKAITALPDPVVLLKDLACDSGAFLLRYNVSNLGDTALNTGYPISIYDADPTAGPANRLLTFNAANPVLQPGTDITLDVPNSSFLNAFPIGSTVTLYAVINDPGALPTPFNLSDLEPGGLPDLLFDDNLHANTYTLLGGPLLDLGPDLVLCDDTTLVLNAGNGFVTYLWQDGSTAPTFSTDTIGLFWVETTDACGFTQRDSITTTLSLAADVILSDDSLCLGDSIVLNLSGFDTYVWTPAAGLSCTDCGNVVIKPTATTTYTLNATSADGCSLTDTFTVAILNEQISVAAISCPPNISVTVPSGATTIQVSFNTPAASSDCPCPGIDVYQTLGLPSGADFPVGNTAVCFEAADACGDLAACCFVVRVTAPTPPQPPSDPCDVKTNGCLKYELLEITANNEGDKTYRFRVTNNCPAPLLNTSIQQPSGATALAPANGSTYTAPSGRNYTVRNPNYTPFYSVRFTPQGVGISSGQSEEFTYTLREQSTPAYINIVSRVSPSTFVEAKLNTFNCPVKKTGTLAEPLNPNTGTAAGVLVYPNPNSGDMVLVWTDNYEGQDANLTLFSAQGLRVWEQQTELNGLTMNIPLGGQLAAGIYRLVVLTTSGDMEQVTVVVDK